MKKTFSRLPSDILITAPTLESGKSRLKKLLISITNWLKYKMNNQFIITILGEGFRPIHLIAMFNKTIDEHFLFSDKDCSAIAFNDENIKCHQELKMHSITEQI